MQFGAVDGPSARFNLISNVTSGTLYCSVAFKVTSLGALSTAGGYVAGFNNSRGTQPGTPFVLGLRILTRATGAGGFNLGVAKDTTNTANWVWATNVLSPNQTIFLVGSYTFNASNSTDDVAMLWINPSAVDFGSSLTPAATLAATSGPDIAAAEIASFVFLQRGLNNTNQPGAVTADELRLGTTWASVTPPGMISPTLAVARAGSAAVLSWLASASGFILEATRALSTTSLWTEVAAPVYIIGDQFTVTNDTATGPNFYRLRR
jgi:hypothetical protein